MSPQTTPMNAPLATEPSGGSGAMFDRIAARYDLLNRMMSLGLDRRWRTRLVRSLRLGPDAHVLDVASGTADAALRIAAMHPDARVTGLDPSAGMLAVGAEKVRRRGLDARIDLVVGDAQALPHEAATFDAATIAFGIRNVPDRLRGLREMARVTRPGGRVAVLELGEPRGSALASLARLHVHHVVPRLGALLSGSREYRYLQASIAAFPPPDEFQQMMREAGLADVRVDRLSFGAVHLFTGTVPGPVGAVDGGAE